MKKNQKSTKIYYFVRAVTHHPQTGQKFDSPYVAYRYVDGKCKEALTKEQAKNER